jgi:hypothetical protein
LALTPHSLLTREKIFNSGISGVWELELDGVNWEPTPQLFLRLLYPGLDINFPENGRRTLRGREKMKKVKKAFL